MDTVLANKISKFFLNLERISYSNPFVTPDVLKVAKKLDIQLIPKSMGLEGCAPLGFYKNKMCEIILSDLDLTDEHYTHLKYIANNWQMCPHLLYVNPITNEIMEIEQYNINKRKRLNQSIEVPDSTWVTASSTRNYMLDDPLIDFLKFQTQSQNNYRSRTSTSSSNSRSRSNSDTFLEKIFENGNKFEEEIINKIKELIPSKDFIEIAKSFEARDLSKYRRTIQAIGQSIPVIYQPVLWNHTNKTYGCADLIIRSDYAKKIFPSYPSTGTTSSNGKVYEVYDIKWSSLKLKAGSDNLQNEISIKPYKAQIWIYTDALNKIQPVPATRGFVIGKSYYREKTVNKVPIVETFSDPFEKLGLIDWETSIEEQNIEKTNEAIEWIQEVRTNRDLQVDTTKDPRLYPNMKNTSDGEFHKVKKQLAEKNKEITMLYSVGKRSRDLALESGICKWDDPRINSNILGFNPSCKLSGTINSILEINKPDNEEIISFSQLSNFGNWKNSKVACYVDIETIGKTVYSLNIPRSNFIFMIGLGVVIDGKWTHYVYTTKSLDLKEEQRILQEFNLKMKEIAELYEFNKIPVFHWSNYENTNLKPYINIPEQFDFYDMCKWFKDDEICVKGAFDFKLKSINRALHSLGLTSTIWDDSISNGMDAMNQAYNYYMIGGSDKVIQDIEHYNEIDCKSMAEIHRIFRELF
jgi:predicted RecB family nuclease